MVSCFTGFSSFFFAIIWPPTLLITTVSFGGVLGWGFFFLWDPDLPQPILFFITYVGYVCDASKSLDWRILGFGFKSLAKSSSFSFSSLAALFFRWFLFLFLDGVKFLLRSFADDVSLGSLGWSIRSVSVEGSISLTSPLSFSVASLGSSSSYRLIEE